MAYPSAAVPVRLAELSSVNAANGTSSRIWQGCAHSKRSHAEVGRVAH